MADAPTDAAPTPTDAPAADPPAPADPPAASPAAPAPSDPPPGDWRASITDPDALKFAEDSTDVGHLANRAVEMRNKLSTAIQIPGKDASDEDHAA